MSGGVELHWLSGLVAYSNFTSRRAGLRLQPRLAPSGEGSLHSPCRVGGGRLLKSGASADARTQARTLTEGARGQG